METNALEFKVRRERGGGGGGEKIALLLAEANEIVHVSVPEGVKRNSYISV